MTYRTYYPAAAAVAVIVFACLRFFTVRETEFVLVTQFGRPVHTVSDAGLHMKWSFQSALYFDRRLHVYNPRPSEFLTRDKKNLVMEKLRRLAIHDPARFVETVGDTGAPRCACTTSSGPGCPPPGHARSGLDRFRHPEISGGRMMDSLLTATDRAALEQYGIRVVDVRIKRLNLPEQNKQSVYARMRAERERIARQYRAEGEEQALRSVPKPTGSAKRSCRSPIRKPRVSRAKATRSRRASTAWRTARTRVYKLLRTLESYKKIFDDKTTAILSSDSELLRVLMRGEGGGANEYRRRVRPAFRNARPPAEQRRTPTGSPARVSALWLAHERVYRRARPAGGGHSLRPCGRAARHAWNACRCHGLSIAWTLKVRQLQRLVIGGDVPDSVLGRAEPLSSQFFTGDQNLIHMRTVVQYSVGVPADYLFARRT